MHSGATGALIHTLTGLAALDRFGRSVAGTGDVDGDNVPDIAVAADAGYINVYSGATGGQIRQLTGTWANNVRIARIGDLNGDQIDELLQASPTTPPIFSPGSATVFDLATSGVVYNHTGTAVAEQFGYAIAGVGDLNGDGVSDYAIGSTNVTPKITAFSGATGLVMREFTASGVALGTSVEPLADVNNDGFIDFLAGDVGNGGGQKTLVVLSVMAVESGQGVIPSFSGLDWSPGPAGALHAGLLSYSPITVLGPGVTTVVAAGPAPTSQFLPIPAQGSLLVDLTAPGAIVLPLTPPAVGPLTLPVDLRAPSIVGTELYVQLASWSAGGTVFLTNRLGLLFGS